MYELEQVLTYWAPYQGEDLFACSEFEAPIHIRGSLEHTRCLVDRDVREGGFILCGESLALDPRMEANAREIMAFARVPDLRSLDQQRVVILL